MRLHFSSRFVSLLLALFSIFQTLDAISQLDPLITCDELSEIIERDSSVVLIDIRPDSFFYTGHIPGARNIWRPDIRDEEAPIKGLRATPQKMESLLSKLGVNIRSRIVAYDAKGNPDAARLWWMLTNYGYTNVQLLDGGLTKWQKDGHPIFNRHTRL